MLQVEEELLDNFKHQVLVHEWVERGAAELIYQLIYIPPLTFGHYIMTELHNDRKNKTVDPHPSH